MDSKPNLDAKGNRQMLPLPGIDPRPSSPLPVAIPAELFQVTPVDVWSLNRKKLLAVKRRERDEDSYRA